ncbi:hypothetical protein B0H13DRAFT_2340156 [Mycena leptocephala]|nr:hypothetical protein B0H13DRAFT_2340156 [Mycena leptocephala]
MPTLRRYGTTWRGGSGTGGRRQWLGGDVEGGDASDRDGVDGLQLEEQQRTLGFDVAAPVCIRRQSSARRCGAYQQAAATDRVMDRRPASVFPASKALRDNDDVARARIARTQPVPGLQVHDIRLYLPSEMMKQPGAKHAMTPLQMEALTTSTAFVSGRQTKRWMRFGGYFCPTTRLHNR